MKPKTTPYEGKTYFSREDCLHIVEGYIGHRLINPDAFSEIDVRGIVEYVDTLHGDLLEENKEEIENLENENEVLTDRVEELESKITNLEITLEEIKEDKQNMQNNIDRLTIVASTMTPQEVLNMLFQVYQELIDDLELPPDIFKGYKVALDAIGQIIFPPL